MKQWSAITREQFEAYLADAEKLIQFAKEQRIPIFASGLAGVAMIREALQTMGGDVRWWLEFVRTGMLPNLTWPAVDEPPATSRSS